MAIHANIVLTNNDMDESSLIDSFVEQVWRKSSFGSLENVIIRQRPGKP